jgi:hypothetical protein
VIIPYEWIWYEYLIIFLCSAYIILLELCVPHHFSRWLRDRECSFGRTIACYGLSHWDDVILRVVLCTEDYSVMVSSSLSCARALAMLPPDKNMMWVGSLWGPSDVKTASLLVRLVWTATCGSCNWAKMVDVIWCFFVKRKATNFSHFGNFGPISWFPGRPAVQVPANFLKKSQQDYKPDDPQIASNFDARRGRDWSMFPSPSRLVSQMGIETLQYRKTMKNIWKTIDNHIVRSSLESEPTFKILQLAGPGYGRSIPRPWPILIKPHEFLC